MNKRLCHILTLCLLLIAGSAIASTNPQTDTVDRPSPIKVSLITFYPGNEVFEVFGHSEILVTDSTNSYYINYGVFDFNSPGFVTRYIMGETDYLCAIMPPNVDGGVKKGRKMIKQDLNLTPEQAQQVWEILRWNVQPANRVYRYRHFSDNCSTRPRDVIEAALGQELDYSNCRYIVGNTLRQVMSYYTRNYPWEQFGIDLVLGAACDTVIDARTQTFVPLFLMHALNDVTVDGGAKLVKSSQVIAPGKDEGLVLPPTPWYLHPLTITLLVLAITIVVTLRDRRRGCRSRWFDVVLFTVAGLAGCIIFFVEFVSTHEAVMPNYNILWLHPLLLVVAFLSTKKKTTRTLRWCHVVNIALIATMAVIWLSGLQVANDAFYPLAAALLLRSLAAVAHKEQ